MDKIYEMKNVHFIDSLSVADESGNKSIDDLLDEKKALVDEMKLLEQKILQIRKRLNVIEEELQPENISISLPSIDLCTPSLNKNASLLEKAEFMMSLFHGRRDVFPRRKYNTDKQKASYYPVLSCFYKDYCRKKQTRNLIVENVMIEVMLL